MSGFDRDALSRFIDGEGTEAEDRAIRSDSDARAAADALRKQDAALGAWFDGLADAPPPPALEQAVRTGFKVRRAKRRGYRWLAPVAAAAVMIVAGLATFDAMIDRRVSQALEQMRAERASDMALLASAVQDVLESQPSGTEVRFENAETGFQVMLVPQRTWKSASGHWCREFIEVFDGTSPGIAPVSVACRNPDGRWVRVRQELNAPAEPYLPGRPQQL